MELKIFKYDGMLSEYRNDIEIRMNNYRIKKEILTKKRKKLCDFANGHLYFGFHKTNDGWYYREWAPAADEVFLTGDMVSWRYYDLKLTPVGNGVFEIFIPGASTLYNGCHVKTIIKHGGQTLERIPAYIRRVEQDKTNYSWCGIIVDELEYEWNTGEFIPSKDLLIYECHIGMAQEKEGIGTYLEFIENVLPRIKELGYTAIQIMAIAEHPYYGSFGYQVSSYFAPCSRYGTPNELKMLIDKAHEYGIAVLLDVVHSHTIKNSNEGIAEFDGTVTQYCHEGARGDHPAWGTKLFNYAKPEVLHFLLSNLKYWLEEYHFDGFRFDGVTSMIYHDHGLGTSFDSYGKYFSLNTDTDAITYLQLANEMIRQVNPHAITIAEDMSAMPGMCLPIKDGGIGFDYRLAMGAPDFWIRTVKEKKDEELNMWQIWCELTSRRPKEKYIGYVESHDQALVGDKTMIFRLCDSEMYYGMSKFQSNHIIDRGIALHKIFRLLTLSLGGEGYLNFMGNEFGHPEWIDFPREGNGWSYKYCRRQWHLVDRDDLKYEFLNNFDKALIKLSKDCGLFKSDPKAIFIDEEKQVLIYKRKDVVFAVNLSPVNSYDGYEIYPGQSGKYEVVLSSDSEKFGGYGRIDENYVYKTTPNKGNPFFKFYLPSRSAVCLKKIKSE